MKAAEQPASTYARSNAHGLTLAQQNAVDLLAAGKNDTETADALSLNRVTVTRWRLYSPEFRAALADQRAAVWGASADRLRALLPKALDALADALERADDKVTVALAVLKLAGPRRTAPMYTFGIVGGGSGRSPQPVEMQQAGASRHRPASTCTSEGDGTRTRNHRIDRQLSCTPENSPNAYVF